MPDRPPQICPECGKITDGSRFCEAHQLENRTLRDGADRSRIRREDGLKRLYDSWAWRGRRGIRRQVLARDPFCQIGILCEGRGFSVDVDHIVRAEVYIAQHGGDTQFFFDLDNLRGACHLDHSRKTSLENRGLWDEREVVKALAGVE